MTSVLSGVFVQGCFDHNGLNTLGSSRWVTLHGCLQGKTFEELPYYFPDGSVFGLVSTALPLLVPAEWLCHCSCQQKLAPAQLLLSLCPSLSLFSDRHNAPACLYLVLSPAHTSSYSWTLSCCEVA